MDIDLINAVDTNAVFNTLTNITGILINGDAVNLEGKFVTSLTLLNWTTNVTILDGNYTILNNQVVDGTLTAQLQTDTVQFQGNDSRASYTYQPTGYITSGGGRSIATIIILLTALAIGVVAMSPVFKGPLKDMLSR